MKAESEPISDDEYLLRRVHYTKFRNDRSPLISPNAFEPRTKGRDIDSDGISLYRMSCLDNWSEVLTHVSQDKLIEIGVVKLQAAFLSGLGLSFTIKPVTDIKGHVVIPELNAHDYEIDKSRFVSVKLYLAEEGSRLENIVRWPPKLSINP